MHLLRNNLSKEECLKKIQVETFKRVSISFYRYVVIEDPKALRDKLFAQWEELGVLGRIYVAQEGINAQLNVPETKLAEFRKSVDSYPEFNNVPFKIGVEEEGLSFWKLAIKDRKYILADGLDFGEYDVTNVGKHLSAKEFNDSLEKGAVVVDMRNNYESDIGYFEGAIKPDATTFKEELPMTLEALKGKEEEKVLLYCTGGIRCEKASSFLKHHGFKDVNQLHGGIIDYKHQIDREGLESKYKGANFVFDGRTAEKITDDVIGKCYTCKETSNRMTNCANQACHVLVIICEDCSAKSNNCCSDQCTKNSLLPKEEQNKQRKGVKSAGRVVLR